MGQGTLPSFLPSFLKVPGTFFIFYRIDLWYPCWYLEIMEAAKKITIQIPESLLHKAQEVTRLGITPTIRQGLELIAASLAYEKLRKLRGKVKFSINVKKLREDD